MAQEIVIRTWCDRHSITNEQVEATTTTNLSLPGYRDRAIDLCAECYAVIVDELLEVVAKNGRPADREPPAPSGRPAAAPVQRSMFDDADGGLPCPVCEYTGTKNGVAQHWKGQHERKYGTNLLGLYGLTCPVCRFKAQTTSALGVHVSRRHGMSGIVAIFAKAEQDDYDPHGVVAAFRERCDAIVGGGSR